MALRDALSRDAIATAVRFPRKPEPPSPRIGTKGPPVASGFQQPSAHEQLVRYLAEDADHRDWFTAMRSADRGDTSRQADLFSDALVRDARLKGLVTKRTTSMMGRPIIFKPQDGLENDKEAQRAARLVRQVLMVESRHFRAHLSHLMGGAVYGYAVSPLRWTVSAGGYYVPHLTFAHPNMFGYERESLELGYYRGYRGGWDVEPLCDHPDEYVVHQPMAGMSDYPWRRGAIRSCIVPSFIKRNGLRYWLTLAERFGMPQVYAQTPGGLDDDDESTDSTVGKIKSALANLGRYWYAVFGDDVEIHKIEGSGEADAEVHKHLIEWANTEMAIAILGQNLTTEVSGGSFAASETHRWVADDIHLADAVELAETITQQLCEPIIRYNMPGAPVPVCEINTGRKQVVTIEGVVQGVFSANEMRNAMGHPAKPEGEGGDEYRDPPSERVPVAGAPTGPKPANPGTDGNAIGGDGDSNGGQ